MYNNPGTMSRPRNMSQSSHASYHMQTDAFSPMSEHSVTSSVSPPPHPVATYGVHAIRPPSTADIGQLSASPLQQCFRADVNHGASHVAFLRMPRLPTRSRRLDDDLLPTTLTSGLSIVRLSDMNHTPRSPELSTNDKDMLNDDTILYSEWSESAAAAVPLHDRARELAFVCARVNNCRKRSSQACPCCAVVVSTYKRPCISLVDVVATGVGARARAVDVPRKFANATPTSFQYVYEANALVAFDNASSSILLWSSYVKRDHTADGPVLRTSLEFLTHIPIKSGMRVVNMDYYASAPRTRKDKRSSFLLLVATVAEAFVFSITIDWTDRSVRTKQEWAADRLASADSVGECYFSKDGAHVFVTVQWMETAVDIYGRNDQDRQAGAGYRSRIDIYRLAKRQFIRSVQTGGDSGACLSSSFTPDYRQFNEDSCFFFTVEVDRLSIGLVDWAHRDDEAIVQRSAFLKFEKPTQDANQAMCHQLKSSRDGTVVTAAMTNGVFYVISLPNEHRPPSLSATCLTTLTKNSQLLELIYNGKVLPPVLLNSILQRLKFEHKHF